MFEIIIDDGRLFRTVAWLEKGQIKRIRFFDVADLEVQGTLYLGRVVSLAKNLDSAFVDIGLEKPGFLHFKDFPSKPVDNQVTQTKLKIGDSVLVQVAKAPVGDKGAKLTGYVNVRGLRAVLLPFEKGVFVSKEIASKDERLRLKKMAESMLPKGFGLVIRTLSEGLEEAVFRGVIDHLLASWETMKNTSTWAYPPRILHKNSWTDGLLESLLKGETADITVNSVLLLETLQKRLEKEDRKRIVLNDLHPDLLAEKGVRTTMDRLLERQMPLPSGGYLVMDLTEAMTVYDVNSGSMCSEGKLSETVRKLNMEALVGVMDHLTLANIGGMILVDLVNMPATKDQEALIAFAIEEASKREDGIQVHGLTKLGLMEMTRTRERESFYGVIGQNCQVCSGTGVVPQSDWLFNTWMGRMDYYVAQGFKCLQIVTEGPAVSETLKTRIEKELSKLQIEVLWEEHLTNEKFNYKIRPFRSKTS